MKKHSYIRIISILFCLILLFQQCSKSSRGTVVPPGGGGGGITPPRNDVDFWLTKANQTVLLQKQTGTISFTASSSSTYPVIAVDASSVYQTMDGFGYNLTGGSAYLLNRLDAASRTSLLNEIFGSGPDGIGVSYLRISIAASDLSQQVFSYDDMPAGQTDPNLNNFSLSKDTVDLIPVLKQILQINPALKIIASPWSPPTWMKDNGNSMGGYLLPQYYSTYANYFVKYIQSMSAKGITINAVTIQNEPQHGGNNPSMLMTAPQQAEFIKTNLGPAFQAAALSTKIIIWDHNCDNAAYPISILNDAAARFFIDGSAFHLYAGDISALSGVHAAFPDKNLYMTEQWTGSNGSFDGDFKWHMKNVIIGSVRNWSKLALEWNLASDQNYEPHTPGGCTQCKGAITINGNTITRNVSYYIIAQASKFVPAGSKRISSTQDGGLFTAAFLRPDGMKVLIVLNEGSADITFNILFNGKSALTSIPAGSAGTFTWQ
ncbi:MAG: glycoside hydrolase family 30 beta sandwich domain-containing protein [Ferruginibacter sp.]